MITSNLQYKKAYVWVWLPGCIDPIIAGKLEADNHRLIFNYGKSYLERVNDTPKAISLYEPELPLRSGQLPLLNNFEMPGCIRDCSPDAWGRRVIMSKLLAHQGRHMDTAQLDELTYLLESGSDRIGGLDFQLSPTVYEPRLNQSATLTELLESAEKVQQGIPLNSDLDQALFRGSSIGGARPKALINTDNKKYIAKFSSTMDLFSVVKAEFIAMRLAALVGLNVAPVKLVRAVHKDVLLVERFDRCKEVGGWSRKIIISALTLLGLHELLARYASYQTFAEIIRHRFTHTQTTLRELFSRLVFNILVGNTDDHARNHAAFWDGNMLTLTPAYDICPQSRIGNEASQAMLITENNNLSQIKTCLKASHHFLLSHAEALEIIESQKQMIIENWQKVCEEAKLPITERNLLWRRQFLNPFSLLM